MGRSNNNDPRRYPSDRVVTIDLPVKDYADLLFETLSERFGDIPAANDLFFGPDPMGRGGRAFLQGFEGGDRMCVVHIFFRSETKDWEVSPGGMVHVGYAARHGDDLHPIPDAKTFRVYMMMLKCIMWEKDLSTPTTGSDEHKN